ncbi:MAG TPA: hypothetical protein VMM13_10670, partial [Euzebya sp.]|nr:hypothetical protein [Euzebya sp.]
IELFDREFVEAQELTGMTVIGQFRDVDRPDHFVWLRGFHDMDHRRRALAAFYGGPCWACHRDAANATMVDSDDVLLLRPVGPDRGLVLPAVRMRDQQTRADGGLVIVLILPRGTAAGAR